MLKKLEISYDEETDNAYIYLSKIGQGEITETITYDDLPSNIKGDINLDFDKNGMLRGIEIIGAKKVLPSNFF